MQCLKCGRETAQGQVFCKDCLAVMADSPVKQGTPVTIPVRSPKTKTAAPKQLPAQEQVERLEKRLRRARWCIAVLTAIALILGGLLTYTLLHHDGPAIGQNYSTATTETKGG